MRIPIAIIAVVALVAAARLLGAAATPIPRCQGRLSGDVRATFACTALLGTQPDGELVFVVHLPGPVAGVPSLVPGAFQVPGPAAPGTFTLDALGPGKAAVAADGGALYTAAKTSSRRGEVTLTLTSVRKDAKVPGAFSVHGSYRARLVPAGGGRAGEVVVDVRF